MIAIKLLSHLRSLGVEISVDGDRLRYSAANGALTPELRAELKAHKTEIIEFFNEAKIAAHDSPSPITRAFRDQKLPLSFAQQRLWFLDQLEPGNSVYNIPEAVRIVRSLNIAAFEQAINEIVRRHEVLRTRFGTVEGEPVQIIEEEGEIALSIVDLKGLSPQEREREARRLASEEGSRGFDLSTGPMLRVKVVRMDEQEQGVLMTMHHIVSDGWSMGVLVKESGELYESYSRGRASVLKELDIQYADYAIWQREKLKGEMQERELRYWKKQLEGAPSTLELPTDRARPPLQTFRGSHHSFRLSGSLTESLREMSRAEGATMFITLLTAFKLLLYRYSGQKDIVVGTPVAGRTRTEVESLIGFFVNTLVIRSQVEVEAGFRGFLKQVKEAVIGAQGNQELPFERLVEEMHPERNLSHSPLFQVMFTLHNATPAGLNSSGLDARQLDAKVETVKFDLVLSVIDSKKDLTLSFGFNTDLFDVTRIKRMSSHFQELLKEIISDPDRCISEIEMLSEWERHQLEEEWNQKDGELIKDLCIHQLLEDRIEESADAIAVVYEGEHLSYAELNERANQLAHRLNKAGIGPESRVGIMLERSAEMVVSMLGVLKSGGAYVPLDPSYPRQRLEYMLEDSDVSVVISDRGGIESLSGMSEGKKSSLEFIEPGERWEEELSNPISGVTPGNLAYIIYTSGSTGQPKGVLIEHKGLWNLAQCQVDAFDVRSNSRVLQYASISFDASVSEVIMALLAGATLCLTTTERLLPGQGLIELLREEQITTVTLSPSALSALPSEEIKNLRVIISAGEACSEEQVRRWSRGRRFYNAYGPTETTVCATIEECEETAGRLTIGRSMSNTEVMVLDERGERVSIGVKGEIYIGGIGVGRGYKGRGDLTAEKFVPKEGALAGERVYRTGDIGRYTAEGKVEYLGRRDEQVKIRGYRIELGEVEGALKSIEGVKEAAVVVKDDGGIKQLVGYVVIEEGSEKGAREIKAEMKKRLPEYMVPGVIKRMKKMPVNGSGKLDRKRLSEEEAEEESGGEKQRPRTELEMEIARIWSEVLGVQNIGIDDNFFEIGGDSIKAAILINKLQERLKEYVYVVALFDSPTISRLADYLHEHYSDAIMRLFGTKTGYGADSGIEKIDRLKVEKIRELINPLRPIPKSRSVKNRPAIFVLCPPRSGSTLLRVILGGHPRLFAPPELELLSFNTLRERNRELSDRYSFWLEGTVRAVMQIKNCGSEEAQSIMQEAEDDDLTVAEFYHLLQEWIGDRLLVDKTPSYALDIEILKRAEADFDNPLYIHLLRHPFGMIHSFEEAKLEQVFFRYRHQFKRRELAELIWLVSQQNIINFLKHIPAQRQYCVKFEDLVNDPTQTTHSICDFLDLKFHEDMLRPYQDKQNRMTDGIHPLSKMLGDVKFHNHTGIDKEVSSKWKEHYTEDFLGELTWEMCELLGYPRPLSDRVRELDDVRSTRRTISPIHRLAQNNHGELTLSYSQKRLWFVEQLNPGNAVYNIASAMRIKGALNLLAFEQGIKEIVRRHEVLRTRFGTVEGEPVQIIEEEGEIALAIVDLRGLSAGEREREARRLASEEGSRGFDLATGPMLRVKVVRMDEQEQGVLMTMHHIVSDGWSMGVLVRESGELYESYSSGRASGLKELEIQYADYAIWQREKLKGEMQERELRYWKKQLEGAPSTLELPTDRARPPLQTFRGSHHSFRLSGSLTESLREMGRAEGATMFITLLAAFKLLLYRYSGQKDIVVGTPVAGRTRTEVESLIGFFVNTLVIRSQVDVEAGFRGLLKQVKEAVIGAQGHQELPFERLVEEMHPERNLSHSPLFQVMFVMQNTPRETSDIPSLRVRPIGISNDISKFDLTLAIIDSEDGISGSLEYNSDLFDSITIYRMRQCFETLLESVILDPDEPVSRLNLLSAVAQQQLLIDWNRPERSAHPNNPGGNFVHRLFEHQVEISCDSIAVISRDEQLTYLELNRRANQLANYLQSLGAAPDALVAICLNRSLEMLVAMLGVLKTGAAYIPLDPQQPKQRLRLMLDDAKPPILLTQESVLNDLELFGVINPSSLEQSDLAATRIVCLGAENELIGRQDDRNPVSAVTEENLAYVMYTSGSTGHPKGVMITHKGLGNYLQWCGEAYKVGEGSSIPVHSSIGFDLTITSLFPALLAGQTVMLLPEEDRIEALATALKNKNDFSLVKITPAHLQILEQYLSKEDVTGLTRALIVGGEALSQDVISFWRTNAPNTRLINEYGPTETVVGCCVFEVGDDLPARATVPIGRPIANARLYVLDGQLQPVPAGVAGELYIAGSGLARGYLNSPDQAAGKFIANPFSHQPGERFYKSGDIVRYLSDGNLEFLGRADHQIKIRGYRIEPGEIEAALCSIPLVEASKVISTANAAGDHRLVAYVATERVTEILETDLRANLSNLLPDYMIPSEFVFLDALPLTSNGKVDLRALPLPDGQTVDRGASFIEPRTRVERELVEIWEELLNIRPIGVTNNFFELGGHSLLAVRMMVRVKERFGKELPLMVLFKASTIAELAGHLRAEEEPSRWSPLVEIHRGNGKRPFFCVHPIGGQVLCYRELAQRLDPNQPFYGLQAEPLTDAIDNPTTIEEMASNYIAAILKVQQKGPYYLGGLSFGGIVAFEIARQLREMDHEVALLALLDAATPALQRKLYRGDDANLLAGLAREYALQNDKELLITPDELNVLSPKERLNYVLDRMRSVGLAPPGIDIDEWFILVQRHIMGYKARLEMAINYSPRTRHERIVLFRSSESDPVTQKRLKELGIESMDPALGWNNHSSEPVEVVFVPGYHVTMCQEPNVKYLAEKLQSHIDSRTAARAQA